MESPPDCTRRATPLLTSTFCPSGAKDSLTRLAAALTALGARLRVEADPEGVAFEPHPDLLANMTTMTLAPPWPAGPVLHAGWLHRRLRRARGPRGRGSARRRRHSGRLARRRDRVQAARRPAQRHRRSARPRSPPPGAAPTDLTDGPVPCPSRATTSGRSRARAVTAGHAEMRSDLRNVHSARSAEGEIAPPGRERGFGSRSPL